MSNRPDLLRFRMALPLVLYLCDLYRRYGPGAAGRRCAGSKPTIRPRTGPKRWKRSASGFPEVAHISADTLQSWMDGSPKRENLILLDVREPDEFAVSHLRGARPARSKDEALKVLQDTPRNRRIVLYCSVGYRSSELAGFLMKKGVENIYNLEGSIFRWANEGRPVYRGTVRVRVVHPYDRYWGRLLKKPLRRVDPDAAPGPEATTQ